MLIRFYGAGYVMGSSRWLLLVFSMLSACGGGGSSDKGNSGGGSIEQVSLSGLVTYDRVPHNENHVGLNYNATAVMPVRGAVVDLLNESGSVIASTSTDSQGEYLLSAPKNTRVKVRVKAELLRVTSPTWSFKVTDNTSNNAVYTLSGSYAIAEADSTRRNMHAASGWNGMQYTSARSAAPFAVLDNIYGAATRLSEAGNLTDLAPLELRWSIKNKAAEGRVSLGEIGTSFYDLEDKAIYILGDAENDADEYDSHVIVHEWGHYLEQNLFRADSIGGNHSQGDRLDMRVAMSEGFANAFASMLLDDPYYADSSGSANGFFFDVSRRDNNLKGFYSEDSIGSIFYNYYLSSNNKLGRDFSAIVAVLTSGSYIAHDAMTSIFLFYGQLKASFANQAAEFSALMQEQEIYGSNEYAVNESNDAGYAAGLPLYKTLSVNGGAVNACSTAQFGKYNRYGNSQLLMLKISQASTYSFNLLKASGAVVTSQPEFAIYRGGQVINYFNNTQNGQISGQLYLAAGNYIVEVFDAINRDESIGQRNTVCFNIQVVDN